jgi:WD40 repeat protein
VGGGPATPVVCPFKGLAAFDVDDAPFFFGRERLVAELVAGVVGARLLGVVGPSGSGKSSVVRAGLLPALAGGVLPGSERWAQAVMRPGADPLLALHRALRRLERRGVLVVDQFEELFTACTDETARGELAAQLAGIARERGGVVVVVRADFYGRCAAYPELAALLGANHVLVGPMTRDELARAIERPAQRAGLSVEPELVEALLADVEGRPGALPLLSTALLELWRERDARRLRLAAYVRSGGVQGAVARLAERAYVALDEPRRIAARSLLLRLADEDEGGALVRRRIALSELDDTDVVAQLADRRLLTVSDGAVEVAHEALLREWPRLRSWLDEDAEGRRLHRRLGLAAREGGELYRGARLAAALDWADGHAAELNEGERAFLDASRRAATRAQRRLRAVLAGVAALGLLAVVAGVVALGQRRDARAQATAAAAQGLGAQALAEGDLARALLLARQGVALHDTPQTRGSLLAALLKSPAAVGVITAEGARISALALSPDDHTLVLAGDDGLMRFVDVRTRRALGRTLAFPQLPPDPPDGVLTFNQDGSLLAVGGTGPLAVFDVRSDQTASGFRLRRGHSIAHLAFLPPPRGGIGLVTTSRGTVVTRFVAHEESASSLPLGGPTDATALMVSRAGEIVTSRPGGPTVVRDPRTFRPLREFPGGAAVAALSPDGQTMLLGGSDGSVRFLDLIGGGVRTASARHDGAVLRATFSGDGRTAATAGEDNRAIAWDVARAAPLDTLAGHSGRITGLALSRDGSTLYAGGLDGEVLVWDLAGTRRLGRPFATGGAAVASALSPDGRLLAAGHADGSVTVIDARALRPLRTFRATPGGPVRALAFVPGGPLAVGGGDGFLALVDPRSGARLQRLPSRLGDVVGIAARGGRMATLAGRVELWTLRGGRVAGGPRRLPAPHPPDDMALSPDGRTLAVASATGVDLVDAATLSLRGTLDDGARVTALGDFTRDGREIAAGGSAGWARLWSAQSRRPVTAELPGPRGAAPAESVSPDGRMLAAGSGDGTVRLFDLRTQQSLGAALPAAASRPVAPLFTPDGAHLFVLTDTGRAYRWDVRPAAWARQACAVAGRRLTRAEWAEALPGRPYAPAC